MDYCVTFLKALICDILDDVRAGQFLQARSESSVPHHICSTEYCLRCPTALQYVKLKANEVFGVTKF